jgi:hypothetical protein
MEPIAAARRKVAFTASAAFRDKLDSRISELAAVYTFGNRTTSGDQHIH